MAENTLPEEQNYKRLQMLNLRNALLNYTDHLLYPDLFENYTETEKQELINYRQALRDIDYITPVDPIHDIVWPEQIDLIDFEDFRAAIS